VAAHYGPIPAPTSFAAPFARGTTVGRALIERRPVHVADLQAETEDFPEGSAIARQLGYHTILSVPLQREGTRLGTIALRRLSIDSFTDKQIALLQTFADQAVIAIENVRLFKELEVRNKDLGEALERQTATADILRAISQAQTDAQPVFEAIVECAMRLFGAWGALVFRCDGDLVRLAAARGGLPGSNEVMLERWRTPRRPQPGGLVGRTIRTGAM